MTDATHSYAHASSVMATDIGDDSVVMMDVDLASYFGLEDVGAQVWKILAEPHTIDELVAKLTATYEVEPDVCRRETTAFVEALLEQRLLAISGQHSGGLSFVPG
jgi:hypothetical protein